MSDVTATVEVGGHVLVVGGSAGTLIKREGAAAPELAAAIERPGVGTVARDVVDDLSEATGRAETAGNLFKAIVAGEISVSDATGFVDEALGLLERLDRDGRHTEALNLARALNGLLALAMRWAELVRSLRVAEDAARAVGDRAAMAWSQHELGTLELVAGDPVAANRRLSEAQSLRRDLGDVEGLAATRQNLGVACRRSTGGSSRRARRLVTAAAAVLLLLVGAAAGVLLAPDDDEPGAAVSGEIVHLTVEVDGPGAVQSTPAGIDCPDECERDFTPRTEIVLTPEPDDGAEFEGWGGACEGREPCVLRPRRDRVVTARFSETATQPETATLSVDPPVDGRVTSTPEGIDCGDDCTEEYPVGQPVTLDADPDRGFLLSAWGGDCRGGGPCPLTMGEDRTVSATFTPLRTISVTVSGVGTVRSEPAGIECTADSPCSAPFRADAGEVVLTAGDGTFLRWSGDCQGTEPECTLPLDADHSASASFSTPTPEGEP